VFWENISREATCKRRILDKKTSTWYRPGYPFIKLSCVALSLLIANSLLADKRALWKDTLHDNIFSKYKINGRITWNASQGWGRSRLPKSAKLEGDLSIYFNISINSFTHCFTRSCIIVVLLKLIDLSYIYHILEIYSLNLLVTDTTTFYVSINVFWENISREATCKRRILDKKNKYMKMYSHEFSPKLSKYIYFSQTISIA
jgi:hypothetical protein